MKRLRRPPQYCGRSHCTQAQVIGQMRYFLRVLYVALLAGLLPTVSRGQTTLTGSSLAMKSTGSGSGSWTIDRDGYVGTYITVPSAGDVTIHVNASGTA